MDDSQQTRTEEATPRRRERAREEGQVVFSPDLSGGVMLCCVSLAVVFCGATLLGSFTQSVGNAVGRLPPRIWGVHETLVAGQWIGAKIVKFSLLITLATTGVAVLMTQLQSGFTLTWQPLVPKWEKLSPAAGWNRIFSIDGLARGLLGVAKLATTLATLAIVVSWSVLDDWFVPNGFPLAALAFALAGGALIWGIGDYCFRWFRHEQKLKMSKQELKDEMKDEQVDPQIRAKLRRAQQQQAARGKMLRDVPMATMVITNPTHYAIALKYQTGVDTAPVILAKGADAFAFQIIEAAKLNGVPVFERKPLTRALYALADVGQEIPFEFYRAIAELLAHVYRLKNAA